MTDFAAWAALAAAGAVAPEAERHARGGNGSKLGQESSSPGDHDGLGTKIPVRRPRRARRGASRPFVVASHAESGAWQFQRAARAAPLRTGEGRQRAPLPMRGRLRQVRDGAEPRNSAACGRRHAVWVLSYQAKAGRAARLPHPDESVGARNEDGYKHHTNEAGTTASEAIGRAYAGGFPRSKSASRRSSDIWRIDIVTSPRVRSSTPRSWSVVRRNPCVTASG